MNGSLNLGSRADVEHQMIGGGRAMLNENHTVVAEITDSAPMQPGASFHTYSCHPLC